MQNAPLLIDAHEAGRLLDMLPSRVSRLAKRGYIPCVELPDGELRFAPDELRAWVDEHRRPAIKEACHE
jgi:hypothetical protein